MLTRRNFVTGAIAASVLVRDANLFARASQPSTAVNFAVPPHACDTHTHYYGDPKQFPYASRRAYTPEVVPLEQMIALHRALHTERVVIVTPSPFGTDNSVTVAGIKQLGKNARGIAVIDTKTTDGELEAMNRGGIRGIRMISGSAGTSDPAVARQLFQDYAPRMKRIDWHIQMYTSLAIISALKDLVMGSPVPVVFDHFGSVQAKLGLNQPGFADLLDLVRGGKAYVKVSGVYRSSTQAPDYPDVVPFAKALIEANPDRIVWGSDWPHPDTSNVANLKPNEFLPFYQIDDGAIFNLLAVWAPDPVIRKKILVDNPARLYGF
jgi:predicted TIM-barrel fold metal-dependent hydrolase